VPVPMASAVRSGDLAVTSKRTRVFICSRPRLKGPLLAPDRIHAAYSGRAVAVFEVRFAAWAGIAALIRGRLGEPQQLPECAYADAVQGGAEVHLCRLQIQVAGLPALGEGAAQQRGYFARPRPGSPRPFFSTGVNVPATGESGRASSEERRDADNPGGRLLELRGTR